MRRLIAAAAVAAALVAVVPLHAADSLLLTRFGDYLESLRSQTGIPGMVAVVVGQSDIVWERAFGFQDVDRLVRAQPDTPFQFDGITQTLTAALVLRCADEGRISLDDRISRFAPDNPEGNATVRQVLSHTTENGAFFYNTQRLDVLKAVTESCNSSGSFRGSFAQFLERSNMGDSVPGPDAVGLPPTPGGLSQAAIDRYKGVLARLATPYSVDSRGRPTRSQYSVTGLAAGSGLISTARDYAKFDIELRQFIVLSDTMMAAAWNPSSNGRTGLGWFVQNYNGDKVVWSFGQSDNASSSLLVTLPARSTTLVLLANSDGLAKSFSLGGGDLTTSPFGKLFLELFVK
jgi:CubicO group peptidase (beta-lactamase class C family)